MSLKTKKIFSNLILVLAILIIVINALQINVFAQYGDLVLGKVETTEEIGETSAAEETEKTEKTKGFMPAIKKTVSLWYYVFRYFSILAMLIVLILLGIKLAITSSSSDKAKYKRMLMDWLIGFVIIFCIHYFMALVLNLNGTCLEFIQDIADERTREIALTKGVEACENIIDGKPCYACEKCKKILETNSIGLYETIRTRAYEFRAGIGTSGMIMYMVLVYYTIRFTIIYFKRFFTVMILTIIAPLVGLSYAFTKVWTGKAPMLKKWAEEYCFNVCLQTIHALIYTIFTTMALEISTESIAGFIIALIMFNFMLKADKIFRKIFKFSGKLLDDNADKDMKDDFAAATALKATAAGVLGSQIAKDAKEGIKGGVGTVANWGLVGMAMRENKKIKENDAKLANLKAYSEKKAVEIEKASSEDKKRKIMAEKAALDEQIAQMQERKDSMKNYTETQSLDLPNQLREKDKARKDKIDEKVKEKFREKMTKKALENLNEEEREKLRRKFEREAIVELELEDRKKIREKMGLSYNFDKKEEDRLKREIERELFSVVKSRKINTDERTGKEIVVDGISHQLKKDFTKAVWGNNSVKNATKNMIKANNKRIAGSAMVLASIPLTVANPKVGLALLGKGIKNSKSDNDFKKTTTRRLRRKLRKNKKERLKFNRFNKSALKTIQAGDRMKQNARTIRNINCPSISSAIFTAPLRFTGVLGATRRIMADQYKVEKARKKFYQYEESSYAVARKDSENQDFIYLYANMLASMERKEASKTTVEDAIIDNKKATGSVYEVNGTLLEFKDDSKCSLTQSALVDTAILNVAAECNIVDLNEVNFNNREFQIKIVKQLSNLGLLTNEGKLDIDNPTPELKILVTSLEKRKETLIEKNPDAAKEKLVQIVTATYMIENGIDNPEEIKKEEHSTKIKELVIERINSNNTEEQNKKQDFHQEVREIIAAGIENIADEEERKTIIDTQIRQLYQDKVEEIVEKAINTTSNEEERKQIIEEELAILSPVNPVVVEMREKIGDITARQAYPNPIITQTMVEDDFSKIVSSGGEISIKDEPISQIQQIADKLMKRFDVDTIISEIRKEDNKKLETEELVDTVITSVEEVKDTPTLSQEEQEIIDKPENVSELIKSVAKRKVRKSKKFVELNQELERFDEIKATEEDTEKLIQENTSGRYDGLITHLINCMEEDKIMVKLKVTDPKDQRVQAMAQFDEERQKKTYNNTNIEEILKSITDLKE